MIYVYPYFSIYMYTHMIIYIYTCMYVRMHIAIAFDVQCWGAVGHDLLDVSDSTALVGVVDPSLHSCEEVVKHVTEALSDNMQ